MNIKKGDTVQIVAGKDSRSPDKRRGEVLRVLPKENRVVVQGLNLRRKHQKAQQMRTGRQTAPEIVTFEGAIDASNVMIVCPKCDAPRRMRRERGVEGKSVRVCVKCGTAIDR